MLLQMIKQFNWIDIFIIILLFRICYIAIKNGLIAELFKLSGTILAVYLSFHYYTYLSDIVRQRFIGQKLSLEFLDFLCFAFLAVLGYLALVLCRQVFSYFIKMEALPQLNRWGGLILGISRGFLLSSLIIFVLFISSIAYLKNSVIHSYFGGRLFKIAPTTYSKVWFGFASKFIPQEKYNSTIQEVEQGLKK
jgi:uncharacterized membrane protein required for colicin V production